MMWNTIYYCSCLDPKFGMPSIPDKSIDLGFTDYPWGSNMKKNVRDYHGRKLDNESGKEFFDDSKETITEEFTLEWFGHLERICHRIILVVPENHKKFWYRNTDPTGDIPVIWKNGYSGSKIANKSRKSTYMLYGEFKKGKKFKYDYLAKTYNTKNSVFIEPFTLKWGFVNKEKRMLKHPSPKGVEVPLYILKQLKPESLIDPFAGSGSYIKSADILGIKWIGYELNKTYKHDIDYRQAQRGLGDWI